MEEFNNQRDQSQRERQTVGDHDHGDKTNPKKLLKVDQIIMFQLDFSKLRKMLTMSEVNT